LGIDENRRLPQIRLGIGERQLDAAGPLVALDQQTLRLEDTFIARDDVDRIGDVRRAQNRQKQRLGDLRPDPRDEDDADRGVTADRRDRLPQREVVAQRDA
jgi:hypothetical protein